MRPDFEAIRKSSLSAGLARVARCQLFRYRHVGAEQAFRDRDRATTPSVMSTSSSLSSTRVPVWSEARAEPNTLPRMRDGNCNAAAARDTPCRGTALEQPRSLQDLGGGRAVVEAPLLPRARQHFRC